MHRRFVVAVCILLAASTLSVAAVQVQGVVTDKSRKPVSDAVIQIIENRQDYLLPQDLEPLAECRSDSSGAFHIDAPVSGTISLLAWAPGLRKTRFNLEPDQASARTVGLALESADTISGKVVDADEKPVADALIGPLIASPDVEYSVARRTIPQWTRTKADGTFSFENVMQEIEHRFLTRKPGYEIVETAVRLNRTGITVRLRKGGSDIPGQLFCKSPSVRLDGLRLRLNGNGFDVITTSGATGEFSYSGIPIGTFSLEVVDAPQRPSRVVVLNMPGDAGKTVQLEVSGGYRVQGTVVDTETSTPAAGATLEINGQVAYSDADGRFRAGPFWSRGVPRIEVPPQSGFRLSPATAEMLAGLEPANGFDDITNLNIRVRRQREVHVTIANFEQTTVPALLQMMSPRVGNVRGETKSSSVTLHAAAAGHYYLYALSGGLSSELTTVTIGDAPSVQSTLRLQDAAAIPGKVEVSGTSTSTSLQSFAARVYGGCDPTSTVLLAEAGCRPDGSFFFQSLPNGILKFEISNAAGTRKQSMWVLVAPGRNDTIVFQMPSGNVFAGTVQSADGRPLPGVQVRLYYKDSEGKTASASVETGAEGEFSAPDLDTQIIQSLQVVQRGYLPFREQDVKLPATDFRIVLMPEGNLRAVVAAPASTRWSVHLMQSAPWNRGSYPEQLMSREIEERTAEGGTTVTFEASSNGRYHVVAVGDNGELAVSDPILFVSEMAEGEDVVLVPGRDGQMSGTVKGGSGEDGMEIIATNTTLPEGRAQDFKTALADGKFDLGKVPAGDYLVLGLGSRQTAVATNVEVPPGGSASVDLELLALPTLTGKVTLQGQPQAGVEVRIVSQTENDSQPKKTTTASDGTFSFEYLSADSYWLTASLTQPGGTPLQAQRQVLLRRGEEPPVLNIDIAPPQNVSFRFPANLGVTANTEVTFVNKETRETTRVKWDSDNATAPLSPGEYEVWREDQVLGPASVDADGRVTFGP